MLTIKMSRTQLTSNRKGVQTDGKHHGCYGSVKSQEVLLLIMQASQSLTDQNQ